MARDGDLYDILGVARDAEPGAIKDAFRQKAKTAHPDEGGDPDTFKSLSAAYAVLAAPEKRERYDRTGTADGADNKQARALGLIQHLVTSILDQIDDSPVTVDLIERMRDSLRTSIQHVQGDINELRLKAARTERFAKKFRMKNGKRKSGDNLLRSIAETKAREMRAKIANDQREVETAALAFKILDDYQFDADPEMMMTRVSLRGFGNSTTTGAYT